MKVEVTVTTDAATEPITTAEAKTFLRLDASTEDTLIDELVSAARRWAEKYAGVSLTAKTYTALFSELTTYEDEFDLPYSPVASITSVARVDQEGTETTLTLNDGYYKRGLKDLTIRPVKQFSTSGYFDSMYKIVYTSDASLMNEDIKLALYKLVADFYENRQNERDDAIVQINYDSKRILNRIKKIHFV